MDHLGGLLLNSFDDLRNRIPGHSSQDATEEVQVSIALGIDYVASLAAYDGDWFGVVEGNPLWHHCLMTIDEFFVTHSTASLENCTMEII